MSRPPRPRLTEEERARIIALLEQDQPIREVARQVGRSPASVSRAAKDAGTQLDRSKTKRATEVQMADVRARLAELAVGLVDDAHRLRGQLFAPHIAFNFGGKDNTYEEHEIPEPTARDKQALMTSIGIAVQRAAEIVRAEAPGTEEAKGLVRELLEGISDWASGE